MPTLKEKIIQESQRLGIDKIGFTHAEPFIELEDSLHEQRERGYNSGFEHQNVEERIYPEKTFEHPKSIISIALAYPTKAQGKCLEMKSVDNLREPLGELTIITFCRIGCKN